MTEESENLTIIMSENGRKSYHFKTPLLEGYMLGRDPYREFRKGVSITTYQDDSLTTVNAVLVANYAIYYENRKLWEAKGDVVVTKHDGTRLYTQQLFWNSQTKRIYSNVDTKLVTDTDELIGEGFESDEDMNEPRFRRWKGKMQVDTEQLRNDQSEEDKGTTEKKE
jgi:LPS export ABC transporter protein LptC